MNLQLLEKIRKEMVGAIAEYEMISAGDRVMVAVSGGKDSSVMLYLLREVQKRAPFKFSLYPVMLDQKQPGFDARAYQEWVNSLGFQLTILEEDTYSIVKAKLPEGKTFCSLCSRLRRGVLYNYAWQRGYGKIALGHHRDDLNQTLLLNAFYVGKLASMPPKLYSDDGRNTVIRPLSYVPEAWIAEAAETMGIPVMPCNLCGSQEGLKRQKIANLLTELEAEIPHIGASLLKAQQNLRPSQLGDKNIWDFAERTTTPNQPIAETSAQTATI